MPVSSPRRRFDGVDWEAAKHAIAAGVPVPKVAQELGIPFRALQKRAQRGNWFLPTQAIKRVHSNAAAAKAQAEAQIREAQAKQGQSPLVSSTPKNTENGGVGASLAMMTSHEKSAALYLKELENNDQEASLIGSGLALKALRHAATRKKALPIQTLQDADKAVMLSKRAAGKDRDETGVTVNMFSAPGAQPVEAARGFRMRVVEGQAQTIDTKAITE